MISGLFDLKASSDASTVSGAKPGSPYSTVEPTDHDGHSVATRGQVALGIGAVLAVTGGTLWYLGHREGQPHVDVAIAPGQTEVSFSCAF